MQSLVLGCADDFECVILVNSVDTRTRVERRDGARIIRAGTWGRVAMTPISPAFFGALRQVRADLLHLHCPNPPGEAGCLLIRAAPRLVISYHNDPVRPSWAVPLYRPLLSRALEAADRVLVADERIVASSAHLQRVRNRCTIVPHGIDLRRFEPTADTTALAMRLRERDRGFLILFVGRLRYYKGLHVLLAALTRVEGNLVVVGDGPEETRVRRLASRLGVDDRVRLVGAVPESLLPAYYHAADVVVLPSVYRSETFGLALIEAHACGTPTISTELGTGTSVVNRDGETGFVVRPNRADDLAKALAALAYDQALRARLGRRALELARQRFAVERMVQQTRAVYDEVLAHA